MVSTDEVAAWTGLTLTNSDLSTYEPVAIARLNADCKELNEPVRTQALCYLIASYYTSTLEKSQYASENIGGYSYSRQANENGSYWDDKYRQVVSALAQPQTSLNAQIGVRRVDRHLVELGRRRFP